jgi:galactonate dehydratase
MPGFGRSPGGPELNPSIRVEEALNKQLAAFRDGTGKDVEFLLDLNFNFKTEGYIRLVRALERHRLMWVEIDSFDPRAIALVPASFCFPITLLLGSKILSARPASNCRIIRQLGASLSTARPADCRYAR